MLYIAHRGNLDGPDPYNENNPDYIDKALAENFDVEVDVWDDLGMLFLGHDSPKYTISLNWLDQRYRKLFIHCKNLEALNALHNSGLNIFWHDKDAHTLTSAGYVWTHPDYKTVIGGIQCNPSLQDLNKIQRVAGGVCSDFIAKIRYEHQQGSNR